LSSVSTLAPSRSLAEVVADHVLDDIVSGRLSPAETLPPEAELASSHGVSRLTVREAVKRLVHIGVVEVRRGHGTFVCDVDRWSPLEPQLLEARVRHEGPRRSVRLLLEARRAVERAAAELAARRCTPTDVAAMDRALDLMAAASEETTFARADLDFHDALFEAAGNPYLGALLQPLQHLLQEHRLLTSSAAPARRHAIAAHRAILAAVKVRDVESAGREMISHIDQTSTDVLRYGLGTGEPGRG
jgi:GntR family transcriptional regulator, transcriptional repressor for pyruvate dehydrogenase complex